MSSEVSMPSFVRGLAFFVGGFLVSELVRRLLLSGAGRAVAERVGHPELATFEGAHAASKEAKRAVGLVKQITQPPPALVEPAPPVAPRWVGVARDSAEMLLAAGGVLKTLADVVQQDEKLRRRVGSSRA
jgi:hypothetical protein